MAPPQKDVNNNQRATRRRRVESVRPPPRRPLEDRHADLTNFRRRRHEPRGRARGGCRAFGQGGRDRLCAGARSCAGRASLADVVAERGSAKPSTSTPPTPRAGCMAPIAHPDPAHLHLTGTGLTHLGSAATRDAMHKKRRRCRGEAHRLHEDVPHGPRGRQAGQGQTGVQPEWFYKGNGTHGRRRPASRSSSPAFALDAGEEPEIAGIYLIGDDGTPFRIGFALGNEFSDHVTERLNYLYLAHSKLRQRLLRAGDPGRPAARRHPRHLAHPPRRQDAVGKAVPVGRGQHVAHHRQSRAPPLQICGCSASRATCTSTCSAPRRCPSPTASSTEAGDVFEIEAAGLRPAAAQPADPGGTGDGGGERALRGSLEQFHEKWKPVLRAELLKNKGLERVGDLKKR